MTLAANIESAVQAIKKCNEAHEAMIKAKNEGKKYETPLSPGDIVFIKREQNVANKRRDLSWGLKATVIRSTELAVFVQFDDGKKDWVHRAHTRHAPERPEHLQIDDVNNLPNNASLDTPESEGGGDANGDWAVVETKRTRKPPARFQAG